MRHVVVLDAADVGRVSAFWAQLLGAGVLGHHVFADQAGHPFCIGWGHPTPEALTRHLATNPPSVM